jgi:uncharacterized membrane protein YfcA
MSEWWLAYLGIGVVVGFLAGLLGVGGGAIMVPLLVSVFVAQGLPQEHVLHVALGTSMATIFFTSLSSMRAHHKHGAVDWAVTRAMSPGILAGSFGAALAAGVLPKRALAMIFTVLVSYAAITMFFDVRPKQTRELPGTAGIFIAGALIGIASSLFAAGGAFLSIPFLVWCNMPLRRAIGTAAQTASRSRWQAAQGTSSRVGRCLDCPWAPSASYMCRRCFSSSRPACCLRRLARAPRTGYQSSTCA